MAFLDIFNDDAFSMVEMGEAIDRVTYKPDGLSKLGIFTEKNIRTEGIAIEDRNGALSIIKTSNRGEPLEQRQKTKRGIRSYNTFRIGKGDRILASELHFLREFGQEQQVAELQKELAVRLGGGTETNSQGLLDDVDLTLENMRLGAVQGIVLDADGSPIIDWTNEFDGTGAIKSIAWDLGSNDGTLKKQCVQLKRDMARNSKGAWRAGTGVHALCSDGFYDALIQTPDIIKKYANRADAFQVDGGGAFESFEFGGIIWENYRGTDDGSAVAIADDTCRLFPTKAPGVFMEVFSPGEKFEHIGQAGRKVYAEVITDLKRDQFVDLEVYSYPLHVCTRPQMLYKGTIKPV